jgi:hypothetical protein
MPKRAGVADACQDELWEEEKEEEKEEVLR